MAARAALVFDELELHLLPYLCRRGATSIDVGANLGIYTQLLRRYSRDVLAVEPHPTRAAHLRHAFGESVRVLEGALSDSGSRALIRVPLVAGREIDTRGSLEPTATANYETVGHEVTVFTLDGLGVHNVGFIKIDVEGHELEVIRGGLGRLQRDRPRLLIEMEERHRSGAVEQMTYLLRQYGYHGFFVHAAKLMDISEYDATRYQSLSSAKRLEGGRSLDYVNNFIFLTDEDVGSCVPHLRSSLSHLGRWTKVIRALEP